MKRQQPNITKFFSKASKIVENVVADKETSEVDGASTSAGVNILCVTSTFEGENALSVTENGQPTEKKPTKKWSNAWLSVPRFQQWLAYSKSDNAMFCKICRDHTENGGVWATTGTKNFRVKTIDDHLRSNPHKLAVAAAEMSQSSINKALQKQKEKREEAITAALKTAYWVSTEEIANKKYESLLHFLQHMEVPGALYLNKGGNATYTSPDIFNQLIFCLSEVFRRKLLLGVKSSPFVGIGIDESTDRAQEKHVVVILRYVDADGKIPTTFLKLQKIPDGSATSNFQALSDILNEYSIPFQKVIGLGADGANVMSGVRNGLNGLVKQMNPFCIYVHCVCHRLSLAVSQSGKEIPDMQALVKIVGSIYHFVQSSPSKLQKFKDIASILEAETVKFQKIFEIRWLSVGDAIVAILRNYEPLMVLVSQDASEGDPVAIGILQQLSSFKYISLLHLSADVLAVTNQLSRSFQHRDVSFSSVSSKVQQCLESLEDMKVHDGPYLSNLQQQLRNDPSVFKGNPVRNDPGRFGVPQIQAFETTRAQYLEALCTNLRSRFPMVELLEAMQVFEPASYPPQQTGLNTWGNQHLETLLAFYGVTKEEIPPLVDADCCRGEFLTFKREVFRNKTDKDGHIRKPAELMSVLFNQTSGNRELYPEMFKLMTISNCIMVGNAEAERVFSCQNRIKSRLRTLLSVENLDLLIRISFNQQPIQSFPFAEAFQIFLSKNRRI